MGLLPKRSSRADRRLATFLAVVTGVLLGIFGLLFISANDNWVVIRVPSAPWSTTPSYPAFEAKLFGIMLVCFVVGVVVSLVVCRILTQERRRKAASDRSRAQRLETEIQNLNRLLEVTGKKR